MFLIDGNVPFAACFSRCYIYCWCYSGGDVLIKACKPAFESVNINKINHDCKRDSEVSNDYKCFLTLVQVLDVITLDIFESILIMHALYFQLGIKSHSVVVTQVWDFFCREDGIIVLFDVFFLFLICCLFPSKYQGLNAQKCYSVSSIETCEYH